MKTIFYSYAKNNRDRLNESIDQIEDMKFSKKDIDL